jgi:hypothetical protein
MARAKQYADRVNVIKRIKLGSKMVALELIEPTTPFNQEPAFEVSDRGLSFANATAAKPIYRETAERVLKEFIDRVDAVNISKEYAFRVRSIVLFGSILSSADRLGDVDVAIDLQPSTQSRAGLNSYVTTEGAWLKKKEEHSLLQRVGRCGLEMRSFYN